LIALIADIHANLQAFEACLEDAASQGARRYVFLGDYVGYGGNPAAVLDIVQDMCAHGGVAIKGNHDDMAADFDRLMNHNAASAAKWTRTQLNAEHRAFLDTLPMTIVEEDRLYVHGDATAPEKWRYVTDCDTARDSLMAAEDARLIFCGHVHQPQVFGIGRDGQPRDGSTLTGYGLFDPKTNEFTLRRLPYDIDSAALAIINADLPIGLANRLYKGL
jgi:diadenosine tetraphosphatase ApaH/serine/threonine PP2A family protein phosphatase